MTAGQGPQGWDQPGQQPYGRQQPYGQDPYAQNPYPQQPPGGYGSAPAAPDSWGAPAPVERPQAVRLGVGAWVASILLALLSSILTFAQLDELVDQALLDQGLDPADYSGVTDAASTGVVLAGVVFGLVFVGLELMFVWFAWQGRNWARIVLWVLGGLALVFGLVGLLSSPLPGLLTVLSLVQYLLILVGVVALAQKPASEWYRYRGWQRARGL
ncbi:hypothetical protein JD79_01664 [Geodermatophilus normandii]|uniref:Uncharacterized protein n=1 Tax=Geodermatophilus normandii TaxID=1137989 RepID=A0A317QLI0_9ACTN|nr:hypothetical protein [Geodermatophilus normandii]PWW22510.1 hypothetical protein JD79_01664 [Geodermatophilus normandii]